MPTCDNHWHDGHHDKKRPPPYLKGTTNGDGDGSRLQLATITGMMATTTRNKARGQVFGTPMKGVGVCAPG